jgi:osmotically-inducible protein OsmY
MKAIRALLLGARLAVLASVLGAQVTSDDLISDKVRLRLAGDREVHGAAIELKVANGVVEMSGKVRDEKSKQRAEKVARKVKGVQKVVNKLQVSPT